MPDDRKQREARRATFDDVAATYERVRPGYPDRLFDDLAEWGRLGRRPRVLEIGCGTGKATVALARRGWRITGLEPGAHLARIARVKLVDFPNVRVEECLFEDWPGRRAAFDLVIAAQSFHFVDPAIGLTKAARLLRPGGVLAIATYRLARGDSAVGRRIDRAYARLAPTLTGHDGPPGWEDRIEASGRFGPVLRRGYRRRLRYSAADYVALMETQSHHRLLPGPQRARLLSALGRAVRAGGGSIVVPQPVRLYLARRRVR